MEPSTSAAYTEEVRIAPELRIPRSLCRGLKGPILFKRPAKLQPDEPHAPTNVRTKNLELQKPDLTSKTRYVTQLFELHELLGTGSFGQVFAAKHKKTGEYYAVKQLTRHAKTPLKEEELLHHFNNSKIVEQYASWHDLDYTYMVLEMCSYPLSYIAKVVKEPAAKEEVAWAALADTAEALQYLHVKKFIHNDVKPDNILVTKKGVYKLCDFNVTIMRKEYDEAARKELPRGDDRYTAPESKERQEFTDRVDIYALAVSIIHVKMGRAAEHEDLEPANLEGLLQKLQFNYELKSLVKKMMAEEPLDRPAAGSLVNHPFVGQHASVTERPPPLSEDQIVAYETKIWPHDHQEPDVFCEKNRGYRRVLLEEQFVIGAEMPPSQEKRPNKPKRLRGLRDGDRLNSSAIELESGAVSPVAKRGRLSLQITRRRLFE
ncbi:unnamed protein product [Bursaphelenchus okinawaensis]|uniref:Protein kinase domain-containing protein n=1 Tax=Bursaphelenchus okinawaensis TaxID=465554 RepID=A0A811LS06_9BILA|nr:unnamed protein product [Bursaphelenchus okinawaensis]CAG9127310.1 unnamed protein product [Bursaphelenchus okinawaensis]